LEKKIKETSNSNRPTAGEAKDQPICILAAKSGLLSGIPFKILE